MAVSRPDHVLLVDERNARRKAEVYDLEKTGVVGLMVRASVKEEICPQASQDRGRSARVKPKGTPMTRNRRSLRSNLQRV